MGNKRHRNKVKEEPQMSRKEAAIKYLAKSGFDPTQFTEGQLAFLAVMACVREDLQQIAEATDALGSMLEDHLFEGDDEVTG
jgi:hypothetical protein